MSRLRLCFLVCLLFGLLLISASGAAQDDDADCAALTDTAQADLLAACTDLEVGQLCNGTELVALDTLETVQTDAADPADALWGLALLRPTDDVTMLLFGDAELRDVASPDAALPPTVTVRSTVDLNLRAGPGTDYPVLGALPFDAEAIADGRNAAGDWLRLRQDDLTVWGFADLLAITGAPETLETRADDDFTRPDLYTTHMQAVNLTTAAEPSACAEAGSGLLVNMGNIAAETDEDVEGEELAVVHMQINGVHLASAGATLLVTAPPEDAMQIAVLAGSIRVTVDGKFPLEAETDALVTVMPDAAPELADAYPFVMREGVPVGLLPGVDARTCIAGLDVGAAPLRMHAGPSVDYVRLVELTPDVHFSVVGQAAFTEDAAGWWQLDVPEYRQAWVPQSAVQVLGLCDEVPVVDVPPFEQTASSDTAETPPSGEDAVVDFVPAGLTVWQAYPGTDNMSGTCGGQAIVFCDHFVAITRNADGSIEWRGQEPTGYIMQSTGPNRFAFSGRRKLDDGNLTMALTFTGPTNWSMTMTIVYDNDPACTHTFYYTAVPR